MKEITQAVIDEQCGLYGIPLRYGRAFVQSLGITIKQDSPEAMVMLLLAERIVLSINIERGSLAWDWAMKTALAALQYAVDVVKSAEHEHGDQYAGLREGVIIGRVTTAIITALGAAS